MRLRGNWSQKLGLIVFSSAVKSLTDKLIFWKYLIQFFQKLTWQLIDNWSNFRHNNPLAISYKIYYLQPSKETLSYFLMDFQNLHLPWVKVWSSETNVTSKKSFSCLSLLNDLEMFDWKSFHLRKNFSSMIPFVKWIEWFRMKIPYKENLKEILMFDSIHPFDL